MSAVNGDKSRHNRLRKQRAALRTRVQELRSAAAPKAESKKAGKSSKQQN